MTNNDLQRKLKIEQYTPLNTGGKLRCSRKVSSSCSIIVICHCHYGYTIGKFLQMTGRYYTFIACWWGKYENLFTQEYHIPWGQPPRGIWYSWVNKFSYFLNPHAINVLLYRMKPRKHITCKILLANIYKSIRTLSQTFKNQFHNKL